MCENFPNIRITEGNAFALLLPLRTRTYVSSQPIDEDIDYTQLENIVFTFGGVEYTATATDRGVQIILPDTLAVGTYNAILTAKYLGNDIRAAYESAVTIVPWSAQSTAEQYITGSPIVMRAAYVLSGAMTDAELEALKEEYREKNAQLQQAIEDAEAAKAEWEQKAADLDGVAQEATSQDILYKIDNIDFSTLAKEDTAQQILQKVSVGADALEVEVQEGKAAIVDAIEDKGGTASTAMSLTGLAQAIDSIQVPTLLRLNAITFENGANNKVIDMSAIEVLNVGSFNFSGFGAVEEVRNFPNMPSINNLYALFQDCTSLKKVTFGDRIDTHLVTNFANMFMRCSSLEEIDISMLDTSGATGFNSMFGQCQSLKRVDMHGIRLSGSCAAMFYLNDNMEWLDMRDTEASAMTSISYGMPYGAALLTVVGDATYEEVVEGNIAIYNGINLNLPGIWNTSNNINRASIRAWINGLADRTGQSAYVFGIGATNLAKLSAEDIAVATNKNWTLA